MAGNDYRIYPAWKDLIVYEETAERVAQFDCDGVGDLFYVRVPAAERWPGNLPAWVHDHRDIILQRLRAARCIICEQRDWVTSFFSPDGVFRVEVYCEPDERGAATRYSIRVVMNQDDQVLVHLGSARLVGVIGFPEAGVADLSFDVGDRRHWIGMNVLRRLFWDQPNGVPRPLSDLPGEFAVVQASDVKAGITPTDFRPNATTKTRQVLYLIGCALFIGAGIWQSLVGNTIRDRMMGVFCIVFFGGCALLSMGANRGETQLENHQSLENKVEDRATPPGQK